MKLLLTALPNLLAGFKGPTSKGRGRGGERGEGKEEEIRGREGGGKGRGDASKY